MHRFSKHALTSAILLTPAVAFADVSDKEPSLFAVWMLGIGFSMRFVYQ